MQFAEIGSEYWNNTHCLMENDNKIFPENSTWYLSGGSALDSIIQDIKKRFFVKKVAIPSWCCESMILPFKRRGIEVVFYSITYSDQGLILDDENIASCDAVLIVDYFGYSSSFFNLESKVTIRDLTHSIFCTGYRQENDYYFASLRKWSGFLGCAVAWKNGGGRLSVPDETSEMKKYLSLRKSALFLKEQYINGKSNDKGYLKLFREAEELLVSGLYGPAVLEDIEVAKRLDVLAITTKRRENAQFLLEKLKKIALFKELKESDCPLFVPVILSSPERRDGLRKELIESRIYCPIHWPNSSHHNIETRISGINNFELSLICDQRYSVEDLVKEREISIKYL